MEQLLNYALEEAGPLTLLIVALALIWDRIKRLEDWQKVVDERLWEMQGDGE